MTNKNNFTSLGLSQTVCAGIIKKGFDSPTPIQALTIPTMLDDKTDIIAQAQTGTGKTAAFGLPLLDLIDVEDKTTQALILAPTRELAIQVSDEINSLKGSIPLSITPVYGGQSIDIQLRKLKKGVHIVVGTPGRVLDHIKRKTLKLDVIEHLVIDEADEMLNMGFVEDMEEIMANTNENKRTLLFSATMPKKIRDLAKNYMHDPKHLKVEAVEQTTNLTEQFYVDVKAPKKFESLCKILDMSDGFYGMVFCKTKSDVDTVTIELRDANYSAEAIHGDITQSKREKTLDKFKQRKITILVATDVAARGIDVNDLTHVINYSLPQDPESYTHRVGRTGRAGKKGTAITLITSRDARNFQFIKRITKFEIQKLFLPSGKDIINLKRKKITESLALITEPTKDYISWANELSQSNDNEFLLAKVLQFAFHDALSATNYGSSAKKNGSADTTRLFVALGKKDNLSIRKLIDLIKSKVRCQSDDIQEVKMLDSFSFITVPEQLATTIINAFRQKGKKPLVTLANESK